MSDDSNTVAGKLIKLRARMVQEGVDGFLIPRGDEYQGEFVAPYAERLAWLSGFSGSAGIAIVLQDRAVVMSDGRYTIQLKQQVDTRYFDAVNSVLTPVGMWLFENAQEGAAIGYDPRLHTSAQIASIEAVVAVKNMCLRPVERNLIDSIWDNQPELPMGRVEIFPEHIAGETVIDKCTRLQAAVKERGGCAQILASPESVCWLLNIRGSDVECIPIVLSEAIFYAESGAVDWFVDAQKLSADLRSYYENNAEIRIRPRAELEAALKDLGALAHSTGQPVLLDEARSSAFYKHVLEQSRVPISNAKDLCVNMRAIKNTAEQDYILSTHYADGVALCRFLLWLERLGYDGGLSELDIADKLEALRARSPEYRGPSFYPIAGFAENGAIVHYRATPENFSYLDKPSLLLVDSGGQYTGGTTDLTRTIAMGTPSDDMRAHYTYVLKGHIALARAKFPKGTTGAQIDVFARAPLWEQGLDFAHGTGHGVGCYLSVHEEAASISARGKDALLPGMLLSNEPGYYKEGAYGIRIENLVLVKDTGDVIADTKAPLYHFETISFVPFDLKLIQKSLLSAEEVEWINAYHSKVYEKLSGLMDEAEQQWLARATAEL